MTPAGIDAAARAGIWVADHRGELTRAALRAGLGPRDLDSAAWLAAVEAAGRGRALDVRRIAAAAAYAVAGRPLIARGHRARPQIVSLGDAPALAGGIDPLARMIAAEDVAALVEGSRWCADAAREATHAPRGRAPDPDPRGERTRRRTRARERAGQLTFGGWGWQL